MHTTEERFEGVDADVKPSPYEEDVAEHEGGETSGRFPLQCRYVFVTYNQSRVMDHLVFYDCLQRSIGKRMPYIGNGELAKVQFYGARELHADGKPHYHVMMAFGKRVHWRDARANLAVMIDVDGKEEVDTLSIRVKPLRRKESLARFRDFCQAYIGKEGPQFSFGNWIVDIETAVEKKRTKDAVLQRVNQTESREEAEELLSQNFPKSFVFNYPSTFLSKKKQCRVVPRWKADFAVRAWRVPLSLKKWRQANFSADRVGRPRALLLVGPTRTGKTEWAKSFGRPCEMTRGWCMDNFLEDCTHVVLNDVKLGAFAYWREFLACQKSFIGTGKYQGKRELKLDRPVIWTCNPDNDPRKKKVVREYIEMVGVLVVEIKGPLF